MADNYRMNSCRAEGAVPTVRRVSQISNDWLISVVPTLSIRLCLYHYHCHIYVPYGQRYDIRPYVHMLRTDLSIDTPRTKANN